MAATKTFVNSCVAGLALMAHCTDDVELLAALGRLPEQFREAIDCDWMEIAEALENEPSLFILGRGPSYAIASEAALKFKETCGMHAEAYSAAEVMHGPLALVGPGFPVLALAARDASEASVAETSDALADQGRERLRDIAADRAGAHAAAYRDRPSADGPASADRVLLRFRRGLRPPSRTRSRPAAKSAQSHGNTLMRSLALAAAKIFDGENWHGDAAILLSGEGVEAIVPRHGVPQDVPVVETNGMLVPGFVDLQVNGGGGVMLNDRQDVESIRTICAAARSLRHDRASADADHRHARNHGARRRRRGGRGQGRRAGFPRAASGGAASVDCPQGCARPPPDTADDGRPTRQFLLAARARLPALLTTIAPESVEPSRVTALVNGGVVVSLGHSDTTHATARAYAEAGASMVTHLFNAMSQIGNREPGLAGAGLGCATLWTGLIADGFHVDPATIGIALRAKQGPARIFLVTDAMATIGTDMTSFTLNGRTIRRHGGRLTLEDGTLAGADLDMISAVRFMHKNVRRRSRRGFENGVALSGRGNGRGGPLRQAWPRHAR